MRRINMYSKRIDMTKYFYWVIKYEPFHICIEYMKMAYLNDTCAYLVLYAVYIALTCVCVCMYLLSCCHIAQNTVSICYIPSHIEKTKAIKVIQENYFFLKMQLVNIEINESVEYKMQTICHQ